MSKRLILVLLLAFVFGFSFAAYAEVQNLKVSGDINIQGVARNNFDLTKTPTSGGSGFTADNYNDHERDLLSITRVRVDADLTDNVSTTVRLLNERNWNGESTTGTESNRNIGLAGAGAASTNENQIDLDLAYVTLKEFLYSPLTLTVGRQELHFGTDWIIGDPDTNGIALRSSLAEGDLSARKSFDAIRATLDYNPLVIDLVFAKIAEKNTVLNDDTTLYGMNAGYDLDKNNKLEGFYFAKIRGAQDAAIAHVDAAAALWNNANGIKNKSDQVHTVGARIVNKSVKNLVVDASAAFQFGTYNPKFDTNARWNGAAEKSETTDRRAWGAEFMASYSLKDIAKIAKYDPSIMGTYVYLSGEGRDKTGDKHYRGWDPMFENQTMGHIINAIMGFTNTHLLGLTFKAKPVEDLGVKLDCVYSWAAKRFPDQRLVNLSGVPGARTFSATKQPFIGQEYDLTMTYDYTEDVQFSMLSGWFIPSNAFNGNIETTGDDMRAIASEVIGSMKVTF